MMKMKLCIFLLAASLAAYGQGRSGGHPSGPPSGAGSMGAGSMGAGSMGASHENDHASMGSTSRPSELGKQSPNVLSTNTQLSSRLRKLAPAGTSLQDACKGFKNLGQCVAALHVANNLNISFDDLKTRMTGDKSESLGKAIHDIKPDANAKAEAKKAQKQANQDLSAS